jgi:hypothetical protein
VDKHQKEKHMNKKRFKELSKALKAPLSEEEQADLQRRLRLVDENLPPANSAEVLASRINC